MKDNPIQFSPNLAATVAFLTGFSLMGCEILGARVLAPHFGMTIHVWGALIAVFLGGMSIGYHCGGITADRRHCSGDLIYLLSAAALWQLLFPYFSGIVCRLIGQIPGDARWTALLAGFILFALPAAILGAVSPYLVRLITTSTERVGRSAGTIYAASTIGSIAGTVFAAFYLVLWIRVSRAMQIQALPLILAAILIAGYRHFRSGNTG